MELTIAKHLYKVRYKCEDGIYARPRRVCANCDQMAGTGVPRS